MKLMRIAKLFVITVMLLAVVSTFVFRNALLNVAAYHGSISWAKLALAIGADVNAPNPKKSSLWMAVFARNPEMVQFLLEKGAAPMSPLSLSWACTMGYDEIVAIFISQRTNINAIDPESGSTPIMDAVASKNKSTIELLLQNDADPNQRGSKGYSALELAQKMPGSEGIVELLQSFRRLSKSEIDQAVADMNRVISDSGCSSIKSENKMAGVWCPKVPAGSLIERMGILSGDKILEINGNPLTDPRIAFDLLSEIENKGLRKFQLGIQRGGHMIHYRYSVF